MQNCAQYGFKMYIFLRRFRIMILSALLAFVLVMTMFALFAVRYAVIDAAASVSSPKYSTMLSNYNGLTKREQIIYEKLDKAIKKEAEVTSIMPYAFSDTEIKAAINTLRCDNPEYFYVDFNSMTTYKSRRRSRIGIKYNASAEKITEMKAELDAVIETAVLYASQAEDEIGKELLLHDFLIDNCTRLADADGLFNTAYGALVNGKASSDAYALAMKLMLNASGITAIAVYGDADGSDHIWNMVFADGHCYQLDTAWDDPDFAFAPGLRFHAYFNLTDEQMLIDHRLADSEGLPTANDKKDYYEYRGLYAENIEQLRTIIDREVNTAVVSGTNYFELYPSFHADEETIYEQIIQSIDAVNEYVVKNNIDVPIMKSVARIFKCSTSSQALTIQIFYE